MSSSPSRLQKLAHLSDDEKRALIANLVKTRARASKTEEPMSHGQKALWFIHRLASDSAAYHVGAALRVRSRLDVPALHRALQRLTNRHAVLRATFHDRGGNPVQIISGYRDVAFQLIELPGAQEDLLRDEVQRAYQRPFDLARESVFRATVVRRAEDDLVLVLTIHHIAYDGWSLWLNLSELQTLYAAESGGKAAGLPPLFNSYSDFVARQNAMLASPAGDSLWAYWHQQLSCDLHPLNLPFDRPRPPMQRLRGGSYQFTLDRALSEAVKQFAREKEVTVFVFLLAVFCALLHRYSGQDDILVGTPTSGHDRADYADVVGYFVNQVAIRADFSGNPGFDEFLERLRGTVLDALSYQDFPFALLVERLRPQRDPSCSPLVQASFVYQKPQREGGIFDLLAHRRAGTRMQWAGLDVEHYDLPQQEGQFDLELEMAEVGDQLLGVLKYNTDLFERTSIARMARQFETLVRSTTEDSRCPVGRLKLLAEPEREELVTQPTLKTTEPKRQTLTALFEEQAAKTPQATALTLGAVNLTYAEVNARANQLARFLQRRGVGPEVRVAICVDRSLELVIGILGILKAGGAYIPVDPTNPPERLAFIVNDASAPVFVTTASLGLVTSPLPNTDTIALDMDWHLIAEESDRDLESGTTGNMAAYVIYTSGSTGLPKGCIITHHNVLRLFHSTEQWFQFGEHDVWTLFHSFAFDFSVWEIWGALLYGGRLVIVPYEASRSFDVFYRMLVEQEVTVLNQTPSAFRQLIAAEERDGASPDLKLRLVIFGGEALELQSLRPWFERHGDTVPQLVNMYGITETTVHVTYRPLSITDLERSASVIGGPIPDLQLYVLDRYLEPVPIGIPGELYVGGAGLARGYLNRPDLTKTRFIPHPFERDSEKRLYRTGDLARRLADGDIEYLGRLDHQVKVRGFRIELGEIEAALVKHASVSECIVIARKNRAGEMQLVAYVVPRRGATLDFAEIRRSLKTFLPEYMVPAIFVPLEVLPLTNNGKIDRNLLPEPEGMRVETQVPLSAPRDLLEQRLAAIWETVLETRPIGIRDNFFDLGGHSLAALRLVAEVEAEFSVRLPVAALFQSPTIESLAPALRQSSNLGWSAAVSIQKGNRRAPLFFVPGGGGNMVYLTDLARLLGAEQTLYGMAYRGLNGETAPDTSVEVIAGNMLDAIRKAQPSGPYRLGGHCFGGIVAFEIARQLCSQGQEVELLAIVDVPAPLAPPVTSVADPGQAKWIEMIVRSWREVSGKSLHIAAAELDKLDEEAQLQKLKDVLVDADFLPAQADVNVVRGLINVFRANSLARYRSEDVLPVPIKLFRAAEFQREFDYTAAEDPGSPLFQSTLGWKRLSSRPVDVYAIPGNHLTMLAMPNVEALAHVLRSYLVRGERNSAPLEMETAAKKAAPA